MTVMRRGWFHLASGAGVGRVFGFLSNLLLARWLGPTDLGLFNLVTTTVQTSDTLVRCGGDYALNYELGANPDSAETDGGVQLAQALTQVCSLMTLLICIVLAIWIGLGQGLFPSSMLPSQRWTLLGLLLLMIACEGASASGWEILLVSHRTASLALRQGLFFPLRLLSASFGAFFMGVLGAMFGWSVVALVQMFWLKNVLKTSWHPLKTWPFLGSSVIQLLRRGLPFYGANLMASMIFYPLLVKVATGSGLNEVGYLRVGQILQQLFAFLPATLVPVLFLRLRSESTFADQVQVIEKPLRIIWLVLLEVLLLYCMVDYLLIDWIFGADYISALTPSRLLLITALFECLNQLAVQPLLAAGRTRLYGLCQNSSAILSACIGWFWIPRAGLVAYLLVRLLYVFIPLTIFSVPLYNKLREPKKISWLVVGSITLLALILFQTFNGYQFKWIPFVLLAFVLTTALFQRHDLELLSQSLRKRT